MNDTPIVLLPQDFARNDLSFTVPVVDGPDQGELKFRNHLEALERLSTNTPVPEGEPVRGACFTVIESGPEPITKKYSLSSAGALDQEPAPNIFKGNFRKAQVQSLWEFVSLRRGLESTQALMYSLPKLDGFEFGLTVDNQHKKDPKQGVIPRTKENFEFVKGVPGVVCVDFDPPFDWLKVQDPQALHELAENHLGLGECEYAILPSSSSYFRRKDSGALLRGGGKWRIYLFVACQTLIPKVIKALSDRLALVGDDEHIDGNGVSVGQMTLKMNSAGSCNKDPISAIDQAMTREVQPDYGPPDYDPKVLNRDKELDPILNGIVVCGGRRHTHIDQHYIDKYLTLSEAEQAKFDARWARVKELAAPRLNQVREARKAEIRSKAKDLSPKGMERLEKRLSRGVVNFLVFSEEVTLKEGRKITCEEATDNPLKYHGLELFDPFEPCRKGVPDGSRAVFQLKRKPYRVWSWDGGGVAYEILSRAELEAEERELSVAQPMSLSCSLEDHPAWAKLPQKVIRHAAGLAELFAEMYFWRFRWCGVWGCWVYWGGNSWVKDNEGARLQKAIQEFSKACTDDLYKSGLRLTDPSFKYACSWHLRMEVNGTSTFREQFLKMEPDLHVHPNQFNRDSWLLNCKDGTLNLRTGELQSANPADLCTNVANVEMSVGGDCPLWLDTISKNAQASGEPEAWTKYLQELFGLCLLGEQYRVKSFFVALGSGHNGKTALLTAFSRILGSGQYSAVLDQGTLIKTKTENKSGPREDIQRLMGKRLAVAADMPKGRLDSEWLKQYTGGDVLSARGVHDKASVEFKPTAVIMFSTNTLPLMVNTDEATWSRAQVIPFKARFEKDQRITDWVEQVVDNEAPGVVRWALEGLHRLAAHNFEFTPCRLIQSAVSLWRSEMSIVSRFLEDGTISLKDQSDSGRVAVTARQHVYQHFRNWCTSTGTAAYSTLEFKKELSRLGYPLIEARTSEARISGWQVLLTSLDPESEKVHLKSGEGFLTPFDPKTLVKQVKV